MSEPRFVLHETPRGIMIEQRLPLRTSKWWRPISNTNRWAVLTGSGQWRPARESEVPPDALEAARGYQQERQRT